MEYAGILHYKYFYIDNKVYDMNQCIPSNNYVLKVKNSYITVKD